VFGSVPLGPGRMFGIELPPDVQAILALAIVVGMFVLFLRETFPVEVVAISGAAAMLLLGIVPQPAALAVFSNHAPGPLPRSSSSSADWCAPARSRRSRNSPRRTSRRARS
jgi:di/tricarboxylate transporter